MITTRAIEYSADGATRVGYLALPDGDGRRPGLLIAHEGGGLTDYERDRAEELAELGYVAFALDYLGPPDPDPTQTLPRLRAMMNDPDRFRAVGQAGLDILTAQPQTDPDRLAGFGYCAGGTLMLELARTGANLAAVVGFHSGLQTQRLADARKIRGSVLVCLGADDPLIPAESRIAFEQEMREGGVDWRMNLYGAAQHSFTHPRSEPAAIPGVAYHEPSHRRSWRALLDLLDEVFPRLT